MIRVTKNVSSTSSGVIFTRQLAILFIALKLTGYITWPWIWVLSPIWISMVIAGFLIALFEGLK
jgi:hypothetical protein